MNERSRHEARTPDEERATRAIREAPVPSADADFRARLREDFVSGAIEVRGTREKRERARRPVVRFPATGRRGRAGMWIAASLAVAASLAIVAGFFNQGHRWWVAGARGEGVAMIDGRPVPMSNRDALDRALVPGAQVILPAGAEIDLCSDGLLGMQLTDEADVTLPKPPNRWFDRNAEMHVRKGEVRFATGIQFPGARLRIHTPEAAVEIAGTTFAVIAQTNGTCVCVLDGVAKVGRLVNEASADMRPVSEGQLRFVYRDASTPSATDEMRPWERGLLARFRDSMRPWLVEGYKQGQEDVD